MASMVTRSPTWPQRKVPPVLTVCGCAVGCALTLVTAAAGFAAAAGWVGAAAGAAAGGAAGPQAASRPAPVADRSIVSAERPLSLDGWLSMHVPRKTEATVTCSRLSGQVLESDQPIAGAELREARSWAAAPAVASSEIRRGRMGARAALDVRSEFRVRVRAIAPTAEPVGGKVQERRHR